MAKPKIPTAGDIAGLWQASGLKGKLLFTLVGIIIFRLGAQIPLSSINNDVFLNLASGNNIIGFLDLFSGGALSKVSIFALGIGPYITASIIMQLMGAVIPYLENMQKEEGEAGRRKISQYTRVFTVVLALFQSFIFLGYLTSQPGAVAAGVDTGLFFATSVASLTAGAVFIMWLAELLTERGIGNGGSLLIFVGILAGIPVYAQRTATLVAPDPAKQFMLLLLLAIFLATIVLVIIMQEAIRKVIIINPKRQVGNKVYGGSNTFIPFKLNPGGVMPIIFAIAVLLFPTTILGLINVTKLPIWLANVVTFLSVDLLNPAKAPYYVIYFLLIVGLTFFYSSIIPSLQPKEIANNLKKYGSSVPGIKPGKPTAEFLGKILSKTTFIGAIALGIIALVPSIGSLVTGINTLTGIGSTSLIIMVGVALDIVNQIKTHLLARQYEGFLRQ